MAPTDRTPRSSTPLLLVLGAVILGLFGAPATASACEWLASDRPAFVGQTPGATPINAVFLREMSLTGGLLDPADEALLEVDAELSALLNQASQGSALEVMRLREGAFEPGERDYVEADAIAPGKVSIDAVRVELFVDHEADPDACGPSGESDLLVMSLSATDDGTATGRLWLGYFGPDADAAAMVSEPGILLAGDDEILVSLGDSATHARTGVGFSRSERYCFAVAAMDGAGNIGERSDPVCIDTDDPDDPLVQVVEPGCSVGGLAGASPLPRGLALVALLLGLLGLAARRRNARPNGQPRAAAPVRLRRAPRSRHR